MQLTSYTTEWGLPLFDHHYKGLPINSFSVLETADNRSGLLSVARFLMKGIQLNETVTLVTFDDPEKIINKLSAMGVNCQDMIYMERLFILSYKETFSRSLNISTDYHGIFSEIKMLSNDKSTRIAFLNTDLLFNLESTNLANMSAIKLSRAAKDSKTTVLAQYTLISGDAHKRLQEACQAIVECYIAIHQSENKKFSLKVKKFH